MSFFNDPDAVAAECSAIEARYECAHMQEDDISRRFLESPVDPAGEAEREMVCLKA